MKAAVRTEHGGIETVYVSSNHDTYSFDVGRMYLLFNPSSERAFEIARDFVSSGHDIMCVSRYHPGLIGRMWGSSDFQSIWLSDRSCAGSMSAKQLTQIKQKIHSFLRSREKAVVILDGIEYLSLFNDFHKLLRFIEDINDMIMEGHAILLVPVDRRCFDQRSVARLRRFAEIVR